MDVKRKRWLQDLNNFRTKRSNDRNGFKQAFHRNKRSFEGDKVLLSVYLVECYWRDHKIKDGISLGLQTLSKYPSNQDLHCLIGLMYYQDQQYTKAYKYFSMISWRETKIKKKNSILTAYGDFHDNYWTDGTIATTMSTSLDLIVASLFYRARIEFDINSDTTGACDSWRECWELITLNAKSKALKLNGINNNDYYHGNDNYNINNLNGIGNDSKMISGLAPEYYHDTSNNANTNNANNSNNPHSKKPISPYSLIAYNCIVCICEVALRAGNYSRCLDTIRRTLPSLSYFEEFFHRQILFKIGLICFNYLAPVDWINCLRTLSQLTKLAIDTLKAQTDIGNTNTNTNSDNNNLIMSGVDIVSAYNNFQNFLSKSYVYSPKSMDEDCILALMVHQRLCQLILQQSTKYSQRRRKDEFRKQHRYETAQRIAREKEYQQHVSKMKELHINDINFDQDSSEMSDTNGLIQTLTDNNHTKNNRNGVNFNKRQSSPLITVVPDTDEHKSNNNDVRDESKNTNETQNEDDIDIENGELHETEALLSRKSVKLDDTNNDNNNNNDNETGTTTNHNNNNDGSGMNDDNDTVISPNNHNITDAIIGANTANSSASGASIAIGATGGDSVGNNTNSNLSLNQLVDLDHPRNSASFSTLPVTTGLREQEKDGLLLHERLVGAGYNEYILSNVEQSEIERESVTSLLFLTILLSERREYLPLSRLLLRSVNESQIDCSRWYKYGISLFGNGLFEDSMRACWHCLQNDTIVMENSYLFDFFTFSNRFSVGSNNYNNNNSNSKNWRFQQQQHPANNMKLRQVSKENETQLLRHHFCLSACLLASKCAYLMDDSKTALNYARAAVRLSLDKEFIPKCNISVILVDQRQTAYLMFSIACTQEAYRTHNFEDRKALHQLAMKAIVRAYMLAPFNEKIVFNLACTRADLGDIESSLDDIRSLLSKLHAYHGESWHLLGLLLSCKRRWMECYRAIEQALRYNDFAMTLNGYNVYQRHTSLRVYYRYKLQITKCKILIKQNRVTAPLEIFRNLAKLLDFNTQFYKLTKLPNSSKVAPLFSPIQNKNDELVQFSSAKGVSSTSARALLKVRLEYLLCLSQFYLSSNVNVPKFAYHCIEFALQFFGSKFSTNNNLLFQKGLPFGVLTTPGAGGGSSGTNSGNRNNNNNNNNNSNNNSYRKAASTFNNTNKVENKTDGDGHISFSHSILADIYCQLGHCCEKLNDLNLALIHFQTCVAYNHSHCDGLIGLARIEFELGNFYDAKSYVDSALRINASNHNGWSVLGKIQEKLGQYEEASNSFLTSLELERDAPIEPFSCVPRWLV